MLAGGGINLLLGYKIATTPYWCDAHWPFCWDWSAYNVPLGAIVAIIGVFMFIIAFRKGQMRRPVLMCPKCEKPYSLSLKTRICPTCSSDLEPLDGFYERHPELKDNN